LSQLAQPEVRFRFDANQGYTLGEAKAFVRHVGDLLFDCTELVEQPLPPVAWPEMATLAGASAVPLMLDESIHGLADIARAREVGCSLIKLKLCKQGSTSALIDAAFYAEKLGLNVVVGNGVATDVVNVLELDACRRHPSLLGRASESNGFSKLCAPVRYPSLRIHQGCATCDCDTRDTSRLPIAT
jgi:L-alanine-DL-glutamate epimerase-like enolase superfamily enzyme